MTHRARVLALWAAICLVSGIGALRLRVDTDGRAMVPVDDAALASDLAIRRQFGLRDHLILAVESDHPDGVLNPQSLRTVVALTELLQGLPEVGPERVVSLATEQRDRLLPGPSSTHQSFLRPLPSSAEELAALRWDLEQPPARVYTGTLISADRRMAVVIVAMPGAGEPGRRSLIDRIRRFARELERGPDRILVAGAPVAEAVLGDHIFEDLALLVPFSILFICAVIFAGTGRLAGALIGLLKAGVCLVFSAGLMGWCGIPLYLPAAALPIVLTSMSLADEIHLLTRYQELASSWPKDVAIARTFDELGLPVVLGTASSCAGFLSLLAASVQPLAAFGLVASLGIACGMAFSLSATPALLSWLPGFTRAPTRAGELASRCWRRVIGGLVASAARPRAALAVVGIVTLAAVGASSRLIIQDGWLDSFAPGSPLRLETSAINDRMFGVHLLRARLRFPASSERAVPPLHDPRIVGALGAVEQDLGQTGLAGGILGLHSQLRSLAHFWRLASPEGGPPDDPSELERLLSRFDLSPGVKRRREVASDSSDDTVITIFLKHANYRDTARLMAAAADSVRVRLGWASPSLSWGGDVAVSQAMIASIVRSQMSSLPLALLGAFIVAALVHRSVRMALYALLPVAISSTWLLGGMGWLGIPLGVATSMFFSIVVGLGVDSQSIHYLSAYTRLRAERSADPAGEALVRTARPILVNTLSVAVGFGLLAVSAVPANARLGALIALGLTMGAVISMIGLTALLRMRAGAVRPAPSGGFQQSTKEVVP